jgi:predicted dehydrogenase
LLKKYNFAIIGCGRIASRHAGIINKLGNLSAVSDIKPERAEEFAKLYGCKAFTDYKKMLSQSEIDIVSVCTPNSLHHIQSVDALLAGKHVICEKPMALNINDCNEMIQASDKTGKKLFIVKQNRFNPPVTALKKVIDENRLGKIYNAEVNCFWNRNEAYYLSSDWKGKANLDGGTLFTQFSHFIDILYWLIGDVKKVHALRKNFSHKSTIEFEDTGAAILEFSSGAIGTINYTVNSFGKNMEGSITIFAEKGTVKIGGQYLNVLEYQNIENYKIEGLPESRPANDYGFYQGSMSNHEEVYKNVIDVLENNGVIAASAYEGMKTVEIIQKIYDAGKL